MLRLEHVSKRYAGKPAVDDISFSIAPGEFYALLGANGAGKTTTLKMVAGLLVPDSGHIEVLGHDVVREPEQAKRQLAYLPDEPLLYGKLRPLEYLEFVAGLWGLAPRESQPRAEALLSRLGLDESRALYCEALSRGQQQKLVLAGALLHQPRLLVLDEPLTGLDATASRQVKDLLLQQTRDGLAVLFTTHILEVAERLATRIGLIRNGRLIAQGDMQSLRAQYGLAQGSLEDIFLSATGAA